MKLNLSQLNLNATENLEIRSENQSLSWDGKDFA
jgi:hypothetical protein